MPRYSDAEVHFKGQSVPYRGGVTVMESGWVMISENRDLVPPSRIGRINLNPVDQE